MKKLFIASLGLFLSGCVYSSAQSFKDAHTKNKVVIQSDKDYEEAYRIISKNFKRCSRGDFGGNSVQVNSELDTNEKIGKVEIYIDNWMFGANYALWVEIMPNNKASTVNVYKRETLINNDGFPNNIRSWLNGGTEC